MTTESLVGALGAFFRLSSLPVSYLIKTCEANEDYAGEGSPSFLPPGTSYLAALFALFRATDFKRADPFQNPPASVGRRSDHHAGALGVAAAQKAALMEAKQQ